VGKYYEILRGDCFNEVGVVSLIVFWASTLKRLVPWEPDIEKMSAQLVIRFFKLTQSSCICSIKNRLRDLNLGIDSEEETLCQSHLQSNLVPLM